MGGCRRATSEEAGWDGGSRGQAVGGWPRRPQGDGGVQELGQVGELDLEKPKCVQASGDPSRTSVLPGTAEGVRCPPLFCCPRALQGD